jgi:hypothetical protein
MSCWTRDLSHQQWIVLSMTGESVAESRNKSSVQFYFKLELGCFWQLSFTISKKDLETII